jgi:hypothetical protein
MQQVTDWPVRQKMIALLVIAFVNFLGAVVLWAMTDQDSLLFVGLGATSIWAVVLNRLRCPRCQHVAFERRARWLGFDWPIMGGWLFPRRCGSCGWDFNKEYTVAKRTHDTQ